MRSCVITLFVLLYAPLGIAQTPGDIFPVVASPESLQLDPGGRAQLSVMIHVPEQHYLYRDQTDLLLTSLEGLKVVAVHFPEPETKFDPFFKKALTIYPHDIEILVDLEAPADLVVGPRQVTALVAYQGCSAKLCYRPMERPVSWEVQVGADGDGIRTTDDGQRFGLRTTDDGRRTTGSWKEWLRHPSRFKLFSFGLPATYVLTFVGGILTGLTPCVLPLLPVILLIIGVHPGAHRRNFLLACSLTLGIALTYATIGLGGALAGVPIGFLFQQRWVLALIIAFFLVMALSMFGLFSLRLPHAWQQRLQRLGGLGPRGAFLAGISTGLLATPCAGPVVAALVAYVGVERNLLLGFTLLFTYGFGFGVLFIIVGTFYGQLAQRLPKGGAARSVKMVLGLLLLVPAGYYSWVLFAGNNGHAQVQEDAAFALAQSTGRPVLIEFTAKTCPPCLLMEQTTFQDPAVRQAFDARIVFLKIDTTFPTEETGRLIERYGVLGWPTILFVAPDGAVFHDLSLVGEVVSVEQLMDHIMKAQARVGK